MKKIFAPAIATIVLLISCLPAYSQSKDVVMRALEDEMARSMSRLKLNGHSGPYFISYTAREFDNLRLGASCGALTEDDRSHWRDLIVDVRDGNYTLDSSNFHMGEREGMPPGLTNANGKALTIDEDYDALRHALWLCTDTAYKAAIENLEAKKSYLEENNVRERPDDMSKEEPVVYSEPTNKLQVDRDHWTAIVRDVSAIFKQYPSIQRSLVTFDAVCGNDWFINSEGTRTRESRTEYVLAVMASTQANDGMELVDSRAYAGYSEKELPTDEVLEKAVKDMAQQLIRLQSAQLADEYRGPILLEGQASAEFLSQSLRPNLGNAQETLGSKGNSGLFHRNQLKDQLGKRILPQFITVVDDPLAQDYKGIPVHGNYKIDDDGVRAQKIVLVDKGVLKTFCMSRTPTTSIKHSNGHSVRGVGETSILFINSDKQLNPQELKNKLIALGKEAGLKNVIIVRRLSTYDTVVFDPAAIMAEIKSNAENGASGGLTVRSPLLLYSVSVDDGHEELLRGALFDSLSMRVLRDIACTGDDTGPYLVLGGSGGYQDVVAPSILINEVELRKPERETERLPVLPNPYAEK